MEPKTAITEFLAPETGQAFAAYPWLEDVMNDPAIPWREHLNAVIANRRPLKKVLAAFLGVSGSGLRRLRRCPRQT